MASPHFGSDNVSGIAQEILDAIAAANRGGVDSYGGDALTQGLEQRFGALFETEVSVLPVGTGTIDRIHGTHPDRLDPADLPLQCLHQQPRRLGVRRGEPCAEHLVEGFGHLREPGYEPILRHDGAEVAGHGGSRKNRGHGTHSNHGV